MMKTREDVIEAGGELVKHMTAPTYNDGGAWNTWIYRMPDGTFRRVHQETDYRPDVVISAVYKRIEVKEVYDTKQQDGFPFTIPLIWDRVDHIHDAVALGQFCRIVEHKDGRIRLHVGTQPEGRTEHKSVDEAKRFAQDQIDEIFNMMVKVKDET